MDAINIKTDQQLSPEIAKKKEIAEWLGYTVWENHEGVWKVSPPEGVKFLKLRAPKNPAYVQIDDNSFDSYEAFKEYWDNLPEDRRYCHEYPSGYTKPQNPPPTVLDPRPSLRSD